MSRTIEETIDAAAARAAADLSWIGRLAKTKEGANLPTVANVMIILAHDPALRGILAYNAFTGQMLITRAPPLTEDDAPDMPGPYPRTWETCDIVLIQGYLQRLWSPKITRTTTEDAMLAEAMQRQFHPVKDWLRSLKWDGIPRINGWLSATFGADDTPLVRAIAAKFLIAAVRRIMQPGCKFDQMLVLEGAQGIGKSKTLRILFCELWFSDAIPHDLTSKDAAMALLGVWGLEFAEIEHLIRAEVETIKAFLSRSVDRYRPPYGKSFVDRPRQCVLIGTTNSEDYLRDSTGNRRIWPVKCPTADPSWVAVNRDHLWAEAVSREATGEAIWIDDPDVESQATAAQTERLNEDVWQHAVSEWLIGRTEVRPNDILEHAIGMAKERMNKGAEMRVGAILRKLGWVRTVRWIDGKTTRIWTSPPQAKPSVPSHLHDEGYF